MLLESILEDRTLLSDMPDDLRVAFLIAAGRVSRPTRDENRNGAKAFRRIVRKKAQTHDREVRAATEIRAARRAEVFTAPPQLVQGGEAHGADGATARRARELIKPRACYVCKT